MIHWPSTGQIVTGVNGLKIGKCFQLGMRPNGYWFGVLKIVGSIITEMIRLFGNGLKRQKGSLLCRLKDFSDLGLMLEWY
jgi:hypothetical protein